MHAQNANIHTQNANIHSQNANIHTQNATVHAEYANIDAQHAILKAQYIIMHAKPALYQHVFAACQHACAICIQHEMCTCNMPLCMHNTQGDFPPSHTLAKDFKVAVKPSPLGNKCKREIGNHPILSRVLGSSQGLCLFLKNFSDLEPLYL